MRQRDRRNHELLRDRPHGPGSPDLSRQEQSSDRVDDDGEVNVVETVGKAGKGTSVLKEEVDSKEKLAGAADGRGVSTMRPSV